MNNIISVIEQEAKYIQDSAEGHPQFRYGYLAALTTVSEFLAEQKGQNTGKPKSQNTARLLSFQSLSHSLPWEQAPTVMHSLSAEERSTIESVLAVLRSGGEDQDYLQWWLQTFAGPEWRDHSRPCPLFPHLTAPQNPAQLDTLEASLELTLSTMTAHL